MKPIGTITMDYRFVSKDTKNLLGKFMARASTYSDYVETMSSYVLSNKDTADELVLLAIRHCENLGRNELQRRIIETYQRRDVVVPYFLLIHAEERDEWDIVLNEFEKAIENCSDDWIAYFYLIQLYWLASTRSVDARAEERAFVQIENLIETKTSIHCYTPQFYYLQSHKLRYEGDIAGAIDLCKLGLAKAREFDDRYLESRCLKEMGALTGFFSIGPGSAETGLSFLNEAKEICKELDDPRGLIEVLSYVGGINAMSGAFTVWRDINLEMLKVRELMGDDPSYEFHNIAIAFHQLKDGKEALEWAKFALESANSRPQLLPIAHLDVAFALILLDRLSEAEEHIDTARRLNLEAGLESGLAYEYMVNGQLERALGDYDSAIHSFKSALEINERNARFNRLVSCLMYLAETEVTSFGATLQNMHDDLSGPWMEQFENHIQERGLTGYIGFLLCLKSELRFKQGRHDEARIYANEARNISQQHGYEHLKNIINNLAVQKFVHYPNSQFRE